MKHLRKNKTAALYAAALCLLFLAFIPGICFGASSVGGNELLEALLKGDTESAVGRILWYVRLPRVLGGILCGGALALSGAVLQGVLANRLASPSIIGVNSGAGLAVTLCSAFGILGGWRLSLFAFVGAFVTVLLVSMGAKKWGASRGTVILMGVALNAFLGAVSDVVVTFYPEVSMMSSDFRIGDFSAVTYAKLTPAAVVILVGGAALLTLSNELDVLSLGDENARGLGLDTQRMRLILLVLSALLAGAAVSIAGLLSFVGLLVPHAIRRMGGGESRHLLPLCALMGGGFVSLCDTFARVIFAPYELPVGIIMAFLGAPFFLFILIKGKGGRRDA